ncbi:isochorismatase family cysteine hydrolase [Alicyclobacillus sp.]|uniref:cysteine hydrolase family protein n=1 Tax=Alicyclobacillus sp. TaxID=61169 RepID=UPI0025C04BD8|nr:isochorismatase family cysteine hydrolase [Alicyclobacillus sp.]MCL6517826.1 cysteine hydrolase [Alicyclobacillus sp.]
MARALIVIDYTHDFVADDGKLTCGRLGQAIDPAITDLTRAFVDAGDWVVFAVDVHEEGDPYHPESRLFPPHNLRGTPGRNLYGRLGEYVRSWPEPWPDHVRWMDKTRYSAFAGTDLELYLRARRVDEVHLAGVCTDICVLHTAVDAYNKGFRIVVHEECVASFQPAGHAWALNHFKTVLGAEVV